MYWLEDHQAANNIGPLDAGYAIFPQVNRRSSGGIQVQYTWADCPDVAFIPARLRRVEVFCEFYYNIDVQFENGCVREHVRYEKFKIGEIYMKNTKKKAKTKNIDTAKTTSASCVKRAVSAEEFRLKGRLAYYD